jgi:hypothetical protein
MARAAQLQFLFEYADILSEAPQLFINGKSRYRNLIGATLSCILVILSLTGFFYFANQVFLKLNPSVTFNEIYKPKDTELIINTSHLNDYEFYIVNGTDSQIYENQEEYFEFNAWQSTWDFANESEIILGGSRILFEKCLNSTIKGAYCFTPGQILKFQNAFIQFPYTLFYISIRQCIDGLKCRSKEEIREKLKYSFFKVRLPNYYVNHDNYKNPLVQYIKSTESMMTSDFTRRAYYFFSEIQYFSDDGYILENKSYDTKVELSNFFDQTGITTMLTGEKGEDIYFESFWAFENSGIQPVYQRRYKKIQDILAEVGGFINFLRLFALLLMTCYYEYGYYKDILQKFKCYNYNQSSENNIPSESMHETKLKTINLNPKSAINKNLEEKQIHPQIEEAYKKNEIYKISKPKSVTYNNIQNNMSSEKNENIKRKIYTLPNFWEYINWTITCSKKDTMAKFKSKLIDEYFDVKSLIYLRNELDLLKYHILDTKEDKEILQFLKSFINSEKILINNFDNEAHFESSLNIVDSNFKKNMLEYYENY